MSRMSSLNYATSAAFVNQIGHLERQREEIDSAIERLRATHSRLSQGAAA